MTKYTTATSPDRKYQYMLVLRGDGKIGYMKSNEVTPTVKKLHQCPKWIQEVVKNELK